MKTLIKQRKAQGIISIIFFTLVFIIIWGMFIAEQLTYWGQRAVIDNGLTGVEAFFYSNINLLIAIVLLIFILAVGYYGFRGD